MKYIFGNWKMYLGAEETMQLAEDLASVTIRVDQVQVGVFPVSIAVRDVVERVGGAPIAVGAQNIAWVPKGAYTGAVSGLLYKEIGCTHALIGHSERRYIFGETDEAVRKKVEAALDVGLIPVICVGETREDLEQGNREKRLHEQVTAIFAGLSIPAHQSLFVAYEPVWAIGSGEACDPSVAASVHTFIRQEIAQLTAHSVFVLYGGSVDEKNVLSYLTLDTVDGVLAGRASTQKESLIAMIRAAETIA